MLQPEQLWPPWNASRYDTHCNGAGYGHVLFLHPSLLQILLQVEGVSNLAPRQRYGSFQNAVWQIYQREGFRASSVPVAVMLQLHHHSYAVTLQLGYMRFRHTTEATELMSFGCFLTQLSSLHCMTLSRSCLLRLMDGHWA